MSGLALALRQVRYENRAFWRNPAAAFFTFAFPLIFMVIFNLLLGGSRVGQSANAGYFFTPAVMAFSVVTACFTNIAMTVTTARDAGVLKRIRGTPLPTWAYLAGRMIHASLIALLLVVIVAAFGALFYGVQVPVARLPALVLTLLVGAAALCALGLAVTGLVPSADAAPAVVNAIVLPLMFVSNVFIPVGPGTPEWLSAVGRLFPVRHLSDSLIAAYDPRTIGSGLDVTAVLVLAAWGIGGLVAAIRLFRWEPRS